MEVSCGAAPSFRSNHRRLFRNTVAVTGDLAQRVANKSFDQPVFLTPKNYASVHDLATEFADKIRESLVARLGGTILPHTNLLPGANVNSNTGIISFTVNTSIDHNITSAIIQFNSDISESYALLGGDRVENGTDLTNQQDSSTSSVHIEVTGARTFQVFCGYPAQISTMPFVYLRAPGTLNNNIVY